VLETDFSSSAKDQSAIGRGFALKNSRRLKNFSASADRL
jgi:hypothetical protein